MRRQATNVDGTLLKAFLAAYEKFLRLPDLPEAKKKITNYIVKISEDQQVYYVDFQPKRAPGDEQLRGADTSLGRALRFYVRKEDYQVLEVRVWR